jgi:hypothetical protein
MIWGMTIATFTFIHVLISLIGIATGLVVMAGLIAEKDLWGWTPLFLVTTVATSVTGFGFPVDHLLPSHVVGALSLAVLAVAFLARYFHLRGAWRRIYVVCAALALYFNVFVGVVQAFLNIAVLNALAPQQTEPPFLVTQLVVLALFVALTVVAARRFHGEPLARGRGAYD